ncbi:hypothetical protein PGTUg99_032389 [Puccinia graminis f. sp. tritici]|uniref:Uncharacterized protein n=1 Tax=Puccinia graminis f. sp. tritici TaxID=56615 RepID=A0A5B0NT47_PUCGR|nr:hypothetical protein PGTUg99_015149 [Puccinia graminis f. sp. tritici]KAA1129166.1 hypothetical protein PGTUg99_032389 [Puccinia graminis f. sp. tritici]
MRNNLELWSDLASSLGNEQVPTNPLKTLRLFDNRSVEGFDERRTSPSFLVEPACKIGSDKVHLPVEKRQKLDLDLSLGFPAWSHKEIIPPGLSSPQSSRWNAICSTSNEPIYTISADENNEFEKPRKVDSLSDVESNDFT